MATDPVPSMAPSPGGQGVGATAPGGPDVTGSARRPNEIYRGVGPITEAEFPGRRLESRPRQGPRWRGGVPIVGRRTIPRLLGSVARGESTGLLVHVILERCEQSDDPLPGPTASARPAFSPRTCQGSNVAIGFWDRAVFAKDLGKRCVYVGY